MLIPLKDRNPTERTSVVTVALIALNVAAYLLTTQGLFAGPDLENVVRWGAIPCDVLGNCPRLSGQIVEVFPARLGVLSLLTSMFMHANLLHIGGNMLYLWIFGNNIEDRLGRVGFVVFYLGTGFIASGAHLLLNADATTPVVGASGAVSGVLGAYLVLYPHARVLSLVPLGFFFFTVEIPAGILLVVWFVLQLFGGLGGGSNVAFAAHIGGFAAGWLLIRVFPKRRRRIDVVGPW